MFTTSYVLFCDSSVSAIFPTPVCGPGRMKNVVVYARMVEGDMYETASSKVYILALATKKLDTITIK